MHEFSTTSGYRARSDELKALHQLHTLRHAYATECRVADVPKDSIPRFLNRSGGDITDHYIRDSALGELQLAEQETISAHLVKALGSRVGWPDQRGGQVSVARGFGRLRRDFDRHARLWRRRACGNSC